MSGSSVMMSNSSTRMLRRSSQNSGDVATWDAMWLGAFSSESLYSVNGTEGSNRYENAVE